MAIRPYAMPETLRFTQGDSEGLLKHAQRLIFITVTTTQSHFMKGVFF